VEAVVVTGEVETGDVLVVVVVVVVEVLVVVVDDVVVVLLQDAKTSDITMRSVSETQIIPLFM
jgi:hypothetical protein